MFYSLGNRRALFFYAINIFWGQFIVLHGEINEYRVMRLLELTAQDLINLCECDEFKQYKFDDIKTDAEKDKNAKIKIRIVDPVEKEVRIIINKYWDQASLEHKKLNIKEIIIRIISKIIITKLIGHLDPLSKPTDRLDFVGCMCDEAVFSKRLLLILTLLDKGLTIQKDVVYSSFSSGRLFLDQLIVSEFAREGCTFNTLNFIDTVYGDSGVVEDLSARFLSMLKEENLETKISSSVNKCNYNPQNLGKLGNINFYTSAYQYVDSCEKDSKIKSHLLILVDPGPGIISESDETTGEYAIKDDRDYNYFELEFLIAPGNFKKFVMYVSRSSDRFIRLYREKGQVPEQKFENDLKSKIQAHIKKNDLYNRLPVRAIESIDWRVKEKKSGRFAKSEYKDYVYDSTFEDKKPLIKRLSDPFLIFLSLAKEVLVMPGGYAFQIFINRLEEIAKNEILSPYEWIQAPTYEPMSTLLDAYFHTGEKDLKAFQSANSYENPAAGLSVDNWIASFNVPEAKKIQDFVRVRPSLIQKKMSFLREVMIFLSEQVIKLRDALSAAGSKLEVLRQKLIILKADFSK